MTTPLRDFQGSGGDTTEYVQAAQPATGQDPSAAGTPGQFNIIEFLGNVSFFQFLDRQELSTVASRLKLETYAPGQVIFRKDEPGTTLHIIASGTVKISMPTEGGEEAPLALLKAGDYFGELALLDGGSRTASATAVGPAATVTLEREEFLGFVTTHPQCAASVFRALAALIRRQNMQLFGEFFDP